MPLLSEQESAQNRIPEHTAIKNDDQSMALFESLQLSIDDVKKSIAANVPEQRVHKFVLLCIGFFSTIKPHIAQELIAYVKQGEAEKFVYLAYQHIFDALEERKKHLLIDGPGTINNPGKKAVDNIVANLHKLEGLMQQSPHVGRDDVPPVATSLVPSNWITD